jgi:hypothetical protein
VSALRAEHLIFLEHDESSAQFFHATGMSMLMTEREEVKSVMIRVVTSAFFSALRLLTAGLLEFHFVQHQVVRLFCAAGMPFARGRRGFLRFWR